jgi:hypothetical protein
MDAHRCWESDDPLRGILRDVGAVHAAERGARERSDSARRVACNRGGMSAGCGGRSSNRGAADGGRRLRRQHYAEVHGGNSDAKRHSRGSTAPVHRRAYIYHVRPIISSNCPSRYVIHRQGKSDELHEA